MNHQYIQRFTAFIAAAAVAAALAAPVFAAQTEPSVIDKNRTGSLTLIKIRENSAAVIENNGKVLEQPPGSSMKGIRFGALKIADIAAAAGPEGTGIFFTSADSGFLALAKESGAAPEPVTIGGKTYYTADALTAALEAVCSSKGAVPGEVKLNSLVKNDTRTKHMSATDAGGKTVLTGLELGLYLIAEEDSSGYRGDTDPVTGLADTIRNPASPMLVSIPMTDPGTGGTASGWMYDITVYPKNQTAAIPKYIVSESDKDTLTLSDDAEIGETVTQLITSDAPAVQKLFDESNHRRYESYTITDRMDAGLSLKSIESVRLGPQIRNPGKLSDFGNFKTLAEGTDYEVLKGDSGSVKLGSGNIAGTKAFRISFLPAGIEKLNSLEYAGQVAVIFNSLVTREASDGEGSANRNKPELTAKNANTEAYKITGNEPGIYTYRIRLTKRGVTDPGKVSFSVKRNGKQVLFSRDKAGVYHIFDNDLDDAQKAPKTGEISPAPDGTLVIRGLDADTYDFTEKTTQTGYELLKSSFSVALTANNPADGRLKKAVISTTDGSAEIHVSSGTASFEVENMKSLILRTGGSGVKIFYSLGGAAALASAVFAIYMNRRRREEE